MELGFSEPPFLRSLHRTCDSNGVGASQRPALPGLRFFQVQKHLPLQMVSLLFNYYFFTGIFL